MFFYFNTIHRQDLENVFVTVEVDFQSPLTAMQQLSYANVVANFIKNEEGDITILVEGSGEKETFVHEVYAIIPVPDGAPFTGE